MYLRIIAKFAVALVGEKHLKITSIKIAEIVRIEPEKDSEYSFEVLIGYNLNAFGRCRMDKKCIFSNYLGKLGTFK